MSLLPEYVSALVHPLVLCVCACMCTSTRTWYVCIAVTVVVDPDLQVHEVHEIARRARRMIIDCVEDVNDADLHLELNDRRQDETT